jgi:hypothetical protein
MIYLPAEEQARIGDLVRMLVERNIRECGHYPLGISITLREEAQELNFTLKRRSGAMVYEAAEKVEMGGVPNQTLVVRVKERP